MATLSENDIRLVQESWRNVVPIGTLAAEMFYAKLFAIDPHLRALFKDDLKVQQSKLIAMLSVAVQSLGRPSALIPALEDLGRRHAYYGVQPAHYDTVEIALLWALQRGLGEAFTPAVRQSWTAAYALIASTMKEAARSARTAARC